MKRLNRRDLLATLAAYTTITAGPANAACDVTRARGEGFSTKSYTCDIGVGQRLTTTFLRVTDVLYESAGRTPMPGVFGRYQDLVDGHKLIDTPAARTFEFLIENFSYAFEPFGLTLQFDGRGDAEQTTARDVLQDNPGRWRTLGVWDDPEWNDWPLFPLPDALRRAMQGGDDQPMRFLRFANPSDFDGLNEKVDAYLRLWDSHPEGGINIDYLGNLRLLDHIRAGTVDGFLPLVFDANFGFEGCTGDPFGGAHYVPPALYLDLAVSRNEGSAPVNIADFFGAVNNSDGLRSYQSRTPDGAVPFGLQPTLLNPGESVVMVQRLLFGALPFSLFDFDNNEEKFVPKRAEYGPTHLPKGVVVDGTPVAFDGRSHNAVIVGSYYARGSCPYLYSWWGETKEWVQLGKILTECIGPDQAGQERRTFNGLRNRFKTVEREHERSTLLSYELILHLTDGEVVHLTHSMRPKVLNIGETYEVLFDLPRNVEQNAVASCELVVTGFYEKLTEADFKARAAALDLVG